MLVQLTLDRSNAILVLGGFYLIIFLFSPLGCWVFILVCMCLEEYGPFEVHRLIYWTFAPLLFGVYSLYPVWGVIIYNPNPPPLVDSTLRVDVVTFHFL